jgi:GalNAc-alpha-(1->4)-GalNAc-alpha-(1->3)-diNAcBac-PP-undecaprenol alpha-1,4-N-acetyl-D-galactosaminyltransferase
MKKICFLSPSLQQGGVENNIANMANEMIERGLQVSVICIYNKPVFYKLNKSIQLIAPEYTREQYSTFSFYIRTLKFIRNSIKDINPDVIVSLGDYLNPLTLIATRRLGIPVYISDRSSPGKKFPFIVQIMRKLMYPKATGIIAQTTKAKEQKVQMLKNYDNIIVIPNFLREIIEYPNIEKEKIILCVARHYEVKGIDRLFKAYAQLPNQDWKLVIAGGYGPQTNDLKKLANELNISHRIEYLGAVNEIDKVYRSASIFVLSSRSEGLPNALLEAMANGLACISFDINAGPSDVIKNYQNGILVEDGNITELSKQINFLINNSEERIRLGENARKVKEDLSKKRTSDLFYNFVIN